MNRTEKQKMLAGELYRPGSAELQADEAANKKWLARYNAAMALPASERHALLSEHLGQVGAGAVIRPPFFCDYGYNIRLGDGVFLNFNCVILDIVEVSIGEPRFGWDEIPLAYAMDTAALPMGWDGLEHPMALNVGNPHLVFFVPDARDVPLEVLGPRIENDPAFPERININVATLIDGRVKLRTFERGAGETLACGTGACASAVAAIATRRTHSPVRVEMNGGSLTINWAPGKPIRMRGAATHVFSGELDLEAVQ